MSRPVRLRLSFNSKSLLENIQQMYNSLFNKIAKLEREITLISNLITGVNDAVVVSALLANLEKAIATTNAQRLEIIKIQKDIILAQNKEAKTKMEKEESISDEKMIEMQRRYIELKKAKAESDEN